MLSLFVDGTATAKAQITLYSVNILCKLMFKQFILVIINELIIPPPNKHIN